MSLVSNLRTMSLPEVLQWVDVGHKTGMLRLKRRSIEKRLLFENGLVHSSWSNEPREALRHFLMHDGLVTEEQVAMAFKEQEESHGGGQRRLYGSILVSQGLLGEEDLRSVLLKKASESIYEIFLWPDGDIDFKEGPISDDSFLHIEMTVGEVVVEGLRRRDEWAKIRLVFPSVRTTFTVHVSPEDITVAERAALRLAAAGKSLAQISLEMHRSKYKTAVILHGLYSRGAIEVAERGLDTIQPADADSAIGIHLDIGDEALKAGDFAAALKTYHDILIVRPTNERAQRGVAEVEAAQNRELAAADVPLTAVPVLKTDMASLEQQKLDPTEGFVLSRVNGEWDVRSILAVCPMTEQEALLILARFIKRGMIELS